MQSFLSLTCPVLVKYLSRALANERDFLHSDILEQMHSLSSIRSIRALRRRAVSSLVVHTGSSVFKTSSVEISPTGILTLKKSGKWRHFRIKKPPQYWAAWFVYFD